MSEPKYKDKVICRGSVLLGNHCGHCEKCKDNEWMIKDAPSKEIESLKFELRNLREENEKLQGDLDAICVSLDWIGDNTDGHVQHYARAAAVLQRLGVEGLMAWLEKNPAPAKGYSPLREERDKSQEELSQVRKLIAELVKMGKFYADKNNYAGRRSKSDIFSNIIGDNTIYPDRTAFGGRYARDVLSNNKDLIERLTKE